MDIATVSQLIASTGFPIAACCVMFWYMNKERESHQQETKELTNAISELRESITANTTLLTRLLDKGE